MAVPGRSDSSAALVGAGVGVSGETATRRSWILALTVVLTVAAALILSLGSGIALLGDQWAWIFSSLDVSAGQIFQDYNGHLMATTLGLYDVLSRIGLAQFWIYRLVALILHLTVAFLVFSLARRRLGPWLALAPTVVVAFLGTGADAFLSGLNYNVLAATAACLGALLALDRRTRPFDLAACGLLVIGLASFTTAVAYTVGVGVEVLYGADRRRRLWIPLLPGALYAAWRIHWGSTANNGHQGVLAVLHHSFQAAAGAFSGLAGVQLANFSLKNHFPWLASLAEVLLALGVLFLLWIVVRRRLPVTPRLANLTVAGVTLWLFIGLGRGSKEDLYASRYVYQGAILALLILVEMMSAWGIHGRRLIRLLLAGVTVTVALNILWLGVFARHLRDESAVARARLAALEIAERNVPKQFQPTIDFGLNRMTAGQYFEAVRRFGESPAYTTADLRHAPAQAREAADKILIRAFHVRLVPDRSPLGGRPPVVERVAAGRASSRGSCLLLGSRGSGVVVEVSLRPSTRLLLQQATPDGTRVQARRFSDNYVVDLDGQWKDDRYAIIVAPLGRATDPWHMRVAASGQGRICSSR
jgi:hypothetical protein